MKKYLAAIFMMFGCMFVWRDCAGGGFPMTISDVSPDVRRQNAMAGYAPFANASPYAGLVVEGEEEYLERMAARVNAERESDLQTMSHDDYCNAYPLDDENCVVAPGAADAVIASANAPTPTPVSATNNTSWSNNNAANLISSNVGNMSPGGGAYTGKTIGGGPVIKSNKIHNQSCFLAPKTKSNRPNKILTSGRYESIDPAFEKAMITLFRIEGGCGSIRGDPGGYTCYGIASRMNPGVDVRRLTRADAEDIYYNKYYKKHKIDMLPDVIRGDVFMAGVASGSGTAITQFRKMLGLSAGTQIDDSVIAAAENYNGDIHNDFLTVRQNFLVDVAQRKYGGRVLSGYMNSIILQRESGCHVEPLEPLVRQ